MTRDFATDPEILADLRRREASERDGARTRRARNPFAAAAAVEHVEHWPCRSGCGTMVGVSQEAATALAILNAQLVTQHERPIAKHQVMWCPECKRADDEARAAARRPHEQTEIASTTPADQRPSWMPTPRNNRRRNTR